MQRGFTLIELLMVVAIIGLLSSIVITSLQTARLKAADAAIKKEVLELRSLMELERTETGNYTRLKAAGWKPGTTACSAGVSGPYANKVTDICLAIQKAAGSACVTAGCIYYGATSPNSADQYAIMAYLPYASFATTTTTGVYYCVGSSGNQSESPTATGWAAPGCQANP